MIKGLVLALFNMVVVYILQKLVFNFYKSNLQEQTVEDLERNYYGSIVFMMISLILIIPLHSIIQMDVICGIHVNSLIVCLSIWVFGGIARILYEGICKCKIIPMDPFAETEYTNFYLVMCFVWGAFCLAVGEIEDLMDILAIVIGKYVWFDATWKELKKNLLELKKIPYNTMLSIIIIIDTGIIMIFFEKYIGLMVFGEIIALVFFLLNDLKLFIKRT